MQGFLQAGCMEQHQAPAPLYDLATELDKRKLASIFLYISPAPFDSEWWI